MRKRRGGYSRPTGYYNNQQGKELLISLIEKIKTQDKVVAKELGAIADVSAKIDAIDNKSNTIRSGRQDEIETIRDNANKAIQTLLANNGLPTRRVAIYSDFSKIEFQREYSSRKNIVLKFGEYDFKNYHDMLYKEEISVSFDNLSIKDALEQTVLCNS